MRMRFALDLAEARQIVDAGLAAAEVKGWRVTIAVVDDGGVPVLVQRMDEASAASFSTAIEKARSAALVGLPTKVLEAMIGDRPALLSMPNRVAVEGGLPILHGGQRIGGVGVSGVKSDQDAEVAEAGLAALHLTLNDG